MNAPRAAVQPPAFPEHDPGLPRFAHALILGCLGLALRQAFVPSRLPQPAAGGAALAESGEQVAPGGDTRALFIGQGCAACHALDPAAILAGPGVDAMRAEGGRRFEDPDYGGDSGDADAYLREAILDHCLDARPGYDCPDLPDLALRLSVPDLDALVAFLQPAAPAGPASSTP